MGNQNRLSGWALILGVSSGFGRATALALADAGMDILGVHLDRRSGMAQVQELIATLDKRGRRVEFFNKNAADDQNRLEILDRVEEIVLGGELPPIRVVLHSLAFGALLPYIAPTPKEAIDRRKMEMTLDVMAHSLVYWVQDLLARNLIGMGSRVFAMTSEGSTSVMPAYGAVSAAKAALESHIRQLALELGSQGITINAIRAGVTDTPALRMIPVHESIIEQALRRNPGGRLTTPEDVGRALVALSGPETQWINGAVLNVDGGEGAVG